jgi:hypothetical protein
MEAYIGKYFSTEYVRKKILRQTDAEIIEIDAQIDDEIEKGILPDPNAQVDEMGNPIPEGGEVPPAEGVPEEVPGGGVGGVITDPRGKIKGTEGSTGGAPIASAITRAASASAASTMTCRAASSSAKRVTETTRAASASAAAIMVASVGGDNEREGGTEEDEDENEVTGEPGGGVRSPPFIGSIGGPLDAGNRVS